jgi:hypothetical protein
MPGKPDFLDVADRLWPDSLKIVARIDGPADASVEGNISGIRMADGTNSLIDFRLEGDGRKMTAALDVRSPDRSVCSVKGTFPPLRDHKSFPGGSLMLDLVLDRLPVPVEPDFLSVEEPKTAGYLSGKISVRGSMSDPEAVIFLDCALTGGVELEKYLLTIDGGYARETFSDSTLRRLGEARNSAATEAAVEKRGPGGISAGVTLAKSGEPVFTGVLEYPVSISLAPFSIGLMDAAPLLIDISSRRIALNDLDPLLPPDFDLGGSIEMRFKAEGEPRNPSIEGNLKTYGMSVAVARNLQASPSIDLQLGGDLERPSIKGEVTIERALLTLPEMKEDLLDAEGSSILREAADSFLVASDTTASSSAEESLSGREEETLQQMDIDVLVSIPNSFRIESEKLNLELEGELRIKQQGDRPVITGELKPTRGRLTFMGRYFMIQRGSVFFYGGDEMNPSFDLKLTASVSEYDITIELTGTAEEPEIELTSSPAMSESDIMSLLLFGQTMSDLNSSQSNLLQERTAQILMVYGAGKLESEMKSRLGVDMFTFEQSSRDPNKTSLTVGKYINTRTMLKYEQGIEDTANFLINLEYQLTRRFSIETFIDQDSETGLEINWSKEY